MMKLDSVKRPAASVEVPALELAGVGKRYGGRLALDALDLRVARGETLGLLGPNGAGKSTLMKIVVGVLEADRGSVSLGGVSACSRAARAKLGFAPQDLALYTNLSAAENLELFGRLHGLEGRRLRERVAFCLELAGLRDRQRDRVHTFSGGMARRLNLSCAIVHDPEVVLLDEPTVGVDPQSRSHIFTALEQLRAAGLTLLYSTHYMEEAERLCDRVAVLDRGRLLVEGSVSELVRTHGGDFVAQVQGPSLESVFLKLTGRSLRD